MPEAVANPVAPADERPGDGLPRLRVLAIAYACDPEKGSEEGVGWGWVRHIAERHDVVAITAAFNRPSIERYCARHGAPAGLRFRYVAHRRWHYKPEGAWLKIESSLLKPLMNLAYQAWLGDALETAREAVLAGRFDLVHLITYVGYRFPGRFWTLGLPFVWGPIGGMENTPWRLLPQMGGRGAAYYACRNLVNSIQLRMLPGPKAAMAAARGALIAATSGIQRRVLRHYGANSTVICEVGPPAVPSGEPSRREPEEPFEICWSGQHLPGKALPLLLRAAARLPREMPWRLRILGEGRCRPSWQSLARRLAIDDRCRWYGSLPRADALERMRESHALAITSLKDLTSTVSLEALSLGLPLVCLDHCGFADVVTPECGIKVPLGSPDQIGEGLRDALESLWKDEPRRRRLSQGATTRALAYSWPRKVDAIERVYRAAMEAMPIGQQPAGVAERLA